MINYYVGGAVVDDVAAEWAGAHCMTSSGHATSRDSRPDIAVIEPLHSARSPPISLSDVMTLKWPVVERFGCLRFYVCNFVFPVFLGGVCVYYVLYVQVLHLGFPPVAEHASAC